MLGYPELTVMASQKRKTNKYGKTKSGKFQKITGIPSRTISSGLPPKMPMKRLSALCDSKHFPITMAEVVTVQWYPTNGINNGGFNGITFGALQAGPCYSIGTAAWSTGVTWNNYAALAAVFQEYRILKFEIEVIAGNPSAGFNGTLTDATVSCPNIYAVLDREDAINLTSISAACQFSSLKMQSLGGPSSYGHAPIKICMNKPSVFGAVDNDASLVGTLTASTLEYSPWLSCGTNSSGATAAAIPHGYIKFYIDSNNNTSATYTTSITFVIRAFFEYRGID